MPWKSNDDLPESVKNNLPAEAQTIWRKAANGSIKKDDDDEKASKAGWAAVKAAGWNKKGDKWVKDNKQIDLFAKTHQFDAEIFSVGTWNGDKYSDADLENIVQNFDLLSKEIKPPVKLGHNDEQMRDGQPALGWVKSLRKVGQKLVATLTDVPDLVYQAIKAGRYKRISSEIYWDLVKNGKKFKRALAGVALLGADIPAVTNLDDLTAYLSQSGNHTFDALKSYELELDANGKIKTSKKPKKESNKMADDIKAYQDELKTLKAELKEKEDAEKAAAEKAGELESELRKFKEDQAAKLREQHEGELKTFCEDMVKAGKMTPANRDEIVKDLDKLTYSETSGFSIPFNVFKTYTESVEKLIEFGEKGEHKKTDSNKYESASDELAERAEKYAREHKVDYSEATEAILAEDKDLSERYKMEDL